MSVSVERVFRSSLACMTRHDAALPPKYLANRAFQADEQSSLLRVNANKSLAYPIEISGL
jgi:hypothetical protein